MALTEFEKRNKIRLKPARRELGESYIYLIGCGKFTKVGFSADIDKRLALMQSGNPHELVLLKAWLVTSPEMTEECLHAQFEKYRVRGEWFNIPETELFRLIALPTLHDYIT